MLGTLLTIWTIRLSLAAYALWLGMWLLGSRPSTARWLYTVACGLFLIHVACAFHFYHHWSHQAALDDTARQTEQMLGVPFGEGIYFSYLFLLLWVTDVARLWLWPRHRLPWITAGLQLYLAFIALNGAIVFEGGVTRWVGIPAAIVLGSLAVWRFANPQSAIRNPQSP